MKEVNQLLTLEAIESLLDGANKPMTTTELADAAERFERLVRTLDFSVVKHALVEQVKRGA